jgi:type IV secretion system protein VirD4
LDFFIQPLSLPLVIVDKHHFSVVRQGDFSDDWLKQSARQKADGFVVFDPEGWLRCHYGKQFQQDGYRVIRFDTLRLNASAKFNPFAYVQNEVHVAKLVSAFISGTKGGGNPGDVRFVTAETALLTAIFGYVSDETQGYERSISTVFEMLNYMLSDEDACCRYNDIHYTHTIDYLFEEYASRHPNCLSVRRYEHFKHMADSHADIIIESCIERLKPFCTGVTKTYFSDDELDLCAFGASGVQKTVLFVSAGQSEIYDFLASLVYTQLIDALCNEIVRC